MSPYGGPLAQHAKEKVKVIAFDNVISGCAQHAKEEVRVVTFDTCIDGCDFRVGLCAQHTKKD
eukprot:740998-Karenia_brevis.AAC.1